MKLSILAQDGMLSERQRLLAEHRFLFALSRFTSRLTEAKVEFVQTVSPSGGMIYECHVSIIIRSASDVLLSEYDADLTKCVSRAAERANRAVGRSIAKALFLHRSRSVAMNAGSYR